MRAERAALSADEAKQGGIMKSRILTCITALTLLTALSVPLRLAAQKQIRYTVTDLGTLGGTFGRAWGINNNGSVVGYATLAGDTALHAFLWRKGVMTDLGTLAGSDTLPYSVAFSINDNDEVVGLSETSVPDPQNTCGDSLVCLPVLWQNGVITALPTLGGTNGQASAINNRGQVVGIAQTDKTEPMCQNPVLKPTVWEGGQARALPTAPFRDGIVGGAPGPGGNNNRGQVVGITTTCDFSSSRTVLWDKHKVIDMGTIGGLALVPIAINNKEQATGTYTTTAGINRAFLWQDGVATDLGALPGDNFAEGGPINDKGQIVGQSCSATSCTVFLWENDVMTDLNAVVPADTSLYPFAATGINSRGQIVGWAVQKSTGLLRAFLATPCGEDESDEKGCRNGSESASVVQLSTSERPAVILPENLRKRGWRRLGSRYHIPDLGTPKN
jgi:probable HAF family extracellular repeat protein